MRKFTRRRKSMSGAATNAGIEYQQRVAALLLTYQFGQMDISSLLGFQKPGHIVETRFETAAPIDDIGVRCQENWSVDFQVKRALSLSNESGSEFAKVITQFVTAFLKNTNAESYFALATTPDASAKIRYELRKIF